MGKKIYVPGSILVTTPFFCYAEGAAGMEERPCDAEKIECNAIIDGQPVLEITDKFAPSIYNEYYAERDFVVTAQCECGYFWNDPEKCHKTFDCTISEIESLIHDLAHLGASILYKHLCVALVATFETYVCDTFILGAINERSILVKLLMGGAHKKGLKFAKDNITDLIDMWCENKCGSAEIEAIWGIREGTFSNLNKVREYYRTIFGINLKESILLNDIIMVRHELAHRNGYRKDGTKIYISEHIMNDWVTAIRDYVMEIHKAISDWWMVHNKYPRI